MWTGEDSRGRKGRVILLAVIETQTTDLRGAQLRAMKLSGGAQDFQYLFWSVTIISFEEKDIS